VARLTPLVIAFALVCFAVGHASAQTPDEVAPTPEPATLTEPSPTPTATPVAAAADEIVFIGELDVPVGTTVTARFVGVTSEVCATSITESAGVDASMFLLRVPASCAEDRFGPVICWSANGCYFNLAGRPHCTVFGALLGDCGWSDTIAPGKVVDFGIIPIAGPDEAIVLGTVPVPAGATVTLGVLDLGALGRVICGTAVSEDIGDRHSSSFVIRADASCFVGRDLPHVCWRDPPCHGIPYDHPFEHTLQPGRTIAMAPILDEHDPNATPTPVPGRPSGGGIRFLPDVGEQADLSASRMAALLVVALVLLAVLSIGFAAIASLRRA
jgi:hypothetical protein